MSSADPRRPSPPDVDRVAAAHAAVAARRARALIKQQIARRERSALAVLDAATTDPTGAEGSLRITDFLTAMPGIGPTKMRRALEDLRIAPVKRIGRLGIHQRQRLRQFVHLRGAQERPSRLTVLAGPTAVGKGTVAAHIKRHHPEVRMSVSATTRPPRRGEADGVDYFFVDDAEFDRLIAQHELLEWAVVHNAYRYGTPRAAIERSLANAHDVLLEIDLQGARSVRAAMPEARLIFLMPPSWEELVRRLTTRGTEDVAEQQRRLETAKVELAAQDEFDEVVVNHDVATAAEEVVNLMKAPQVS